MPLSEGTRDTTTGEWGWAEFEVRHNLVDDVLARVRFPATKREVARFLGSLAPQDVLPGQAIRALPERRYESAEDVRYTLDALGAFPHPSRFE